MMNNFIIKRIKSSQYGGFQYKGIYNNKICAKVKIDNSFYIYGLYVKKEYRRRGFARKLLSTVIQDFKGIELSLYVDGEEGISNNILMKFYRSLGFVSYNWDRCYMRIK